MSEDQPEGSSIPPYLMMDLGYSIAMFVFAMVGMRFTLLNCFGIDLFNFHTLPAQIAGGVVSVLILFSIYRLVSDPKRVQRLGRKIVGRQYALEQTQRQAEVTRRAQDEAGKIGASFTNRNELDLVGKGIAV